MKLFISFLILMSLWITEAVAQVIPPGPPRNVTATGGDRRVTLSWSPPNNLGTYPNNWFYEHKYDGEETWKNSNRNDDFVVRRGEAYINGTTYTFRVRAVSYDPNNTSNWFYSPSVSVKVTPMMPGPEDFTATLDAPSIGSRTVTLSWTAIPQLPNFHLNRDITDYDYSQNGGVTWTSIGSTSTTLTLTVQNGISYAFRVRGRRGSEVPGLPSRTVTITPLIDAPGTPGTLNIERVEETATLTWNPPSDAEEDILRYEYSDDGGSTWNPTGSTDTTYTVTGLEPGKTYTFLVRAVYVRADGNPDYIYISRPSHYSNAAVLTLPKPKRRIIQDCPVGWVRSDGFAGRNRRVLLYEVNVEMDISNPISMYKPVWVAIYVHPDEALENLEGWKLQVALPYNHHREYPLTAENSIVMDSKIEGVAGGFAFIENPIEDPFPMVGVGFTGAPAPGFDYRLYDETGKRVDFGISCYKRGDIFPVLKEMEDPRVLRQVLLETFDWDSHYLRSEWTVPVPVNAPGAPSLHGVNLVGKWADLKKQ